ncbi:CidA/LrgA family protein [Pararhizobium gei]|uniref:CidA/LrgA family protein n=1 Tax=Pararhizobium gei TaxID=1395951 RepID=UPI0023DBF1DC|nr:CidA/LrgA family protein [Rhizobium gei]
MRDILQYGRHLFQAVVICLFWLVGNAIATALSLPIPGGVIGMVIVLALFACGIIRPASLGGGARWLIGEMLLFFIPAVLAIIDHHELLGLLGLKVLLVIVSGTFVVMTMTGVAVEIVMSLAVRPKQP